MKDHLRPKAPRVDPRFEAPRTVQVRKEDITPKTRYHEQKAVRRGMILFWLFIIAGFALAIWVTTL